jgi:hypothetical protein
MFNVSRARNLAVARSGAETAPETHGTVSGAAAVRTGVPGSRRRLRLDGHDVATVVWLCALSVVALKTFGDFAISNDEGVQHHYGELIIAYYASGYRIQDVFSFENLYLYGGLFDVVAVALSHLVPIDPYSLRHLLCALTGIGGIGAAALTARQVAGPRAALIAAVSLSLSGVWYGSMFNHTKDIPFAAAMAGATLFLIRIAHHLPRPRAGEIVAFGLLAGAALGIRILGLVLLIYLGFAIALYLPWRETGHARWRFVAESSVRTLPALMIAYLVMILAWPWAALAPLNPIRGLLAFSEFHYEIRTAFEGGIYEMGNVPRLYVPIYILVRLPLITLAAVALAAISLLRRGAADAAQAQRDIALLALTVMFPVACQVISRGPAFTGLRHFLFVIPPLAVLAGIGLDHVLGMLANRGRLLASAGFAAIAACFLWDGVTLFRLHPYEYLYYNALVGGLQGASRRYDLDYWFNSMPESIGLLEAYLRRRAPLDANWPKEVYSVAVCGERLPFEKTVTLPQLHFDFKPQWEQSEFFIAPTHMNCDRDLDGNVIGVVTRLGVPIAYVKDRRALLTPAVTAAR